MHAYSYENLYWIHQLEQRQALKSQVRNVYWYLQSTHINFKSDQKYWIDRQFFIIHLPFSNPSKVGFYGNIEAALEGNNGQVFHWLIRIIFVYYEINYGGFATNMFFDGALSFNFPKKYLYSRKLLFTFLNYWENLTDLLYRKTFCCSKWIQIDTNYA